jgi:hypothetical protein
MSQRTRDILNRWVAETVRPVPPSDIEHEARRLATEFAAFAADAGIEVENIETDITEPLETFMAEALRGAAETAGSPPADTDA